MNDLQTWFAGIISRPLTEDNNAQTAPHAEDYLLPSPSLNVQQRIEIYNQQYWWRFYSILQSQFPLLARLFGYGDFNRLLVVPYLTAYPPKDWGLRTLGGQMLPWLRKSYKELDRTLILHCAKIDWHYHSAFFKKSKPPLTANDSDLTSKKLTLQAHVALFHFNRPYLPFRDAFLKEKPDYWMENDFPPLAKKEPHYYLVYRAVNHLMTWEELSKTEYTLLSALKKGSPLEEACSCVDFEEAAPHIQNWFRHWVEEQLLVPS